MNILYKTSATSTGGRDGRAVSADNKLEVKLAAPRNSAARARKARIRSSCLPQGTRPVS